MKCRPCKQEVKRIDSVNDCRADTGTALLKDRAWDLNTKDIVLYQCPNCTHIQSEYILSENFYENYKEGNAIFQYFGELNQIENKIEKLRNYAENNNKLIEIGCGTGAAMILAKKYFENVLGVDPSQKECEVAKEKHLEVIQGEFNSDLNLNKNYDAFMSFQTFEHVENILEILDYAYEILKDGGVGLINIPNGQRIVENGAFHQVILEHINYYTPYSIAYAAHLAGFEIIEIISDNETMELDVYMKKCVHKVSLNSYRDNMKIELEKILKGKEHIAVYGGGHKSHIYSQCIKMFKVDNLYDSDANKQGKYIAGITCSVELPTMEKVKKNDIIIIFASSYNTEIIHCLRNQLEYKGEIVYFEDNVVKCDTDIN